jgi:IS5 family transposase
MSKRRYKGLGVGSFFGEMVYARAVPDSHFLRQLNQVVDWGALSERLVRLYKGKAQEGRPPYDPAVILKMLILSYLYDLSERQTEVYVNDSLSAKCFLGLAVDEAGPDHSTLTAFKRRIIEGGGERELQALLEEVVQEALGQGVSFGSIQVVDSTHSKADVNVKKDERRQKKEGKPGRDEDARWGVKHSRRCRDEQGRVVKQKQFFYGYKAHTSMNAEAEMITSVVITAGNANDGKQFARLVDRDMGQELTIETYAGDRGYDDSENHCLLESKGLNSALKLNDYRTQKKDANKEVWLILQETAAYKAGQALRYKIERKYGEAKQNHGLRRCRYVSRVRYAMQVYLTVIVMNMKRMVKLLKGVNFKDRASIAAASRA